MRRHRATSIFGRLAVHAKNLQDQTNPAITVETSEQKRKCFGDIVDEATEDREKHRERLGGAFFSKFEKGRDNDIDVDNVSIGTFDRNWLFRGIIHECFPNSGILVEYSGLTSINPVAR